MREKSEELCTHCENGTPEICLLNPGGDCMKGDYVHFKEKSLRECDTCNNQYRYESEARNWDGLGRLIRTITTSKGCSLCNSAYRSDCPEWQPKIDFPTSPKPAEREKPESEYERVIELLFDRVKKDFPQVMLAMEQVKYYALAEGARRERERMENGVDKAR